MHGRSPALDLDALIASRVTAVKRLIDFALLLMDRLPQAIASVAKYLRLARWTRIALAYLHQASRAEPDTPRPLRKTRCATAEDTEEPAEVLKIATRIPRPCDHERDYEAEELQRLLRRPFGEAIAIICKGIGMRPDWAAWAAEPWAQEEIRTQPEGSPYVGWALLSRTPEPPPDPRPAPHPLAATAPAPPSQAPPNRHARRAQARAARKRMRLPA
jgi:hypothetical protein